MNIRSKCGLRHSGLSPFHRDIKVLSVIGILAIAAALVPRIAHGGNAGNFVLYNHHTPEAGEMEIMLMTDIGQQPDGIRYTAQMAEFELAITDKFVTEFMIEGQTTSGEGGYNFTGFRWENRYRLFEYGTFLNPVLYVEWEDLSEDTKYLMEVSGREDAPPREKKRPRERILETRLIVGQDFMENRLDVSFNWINESDMDTRVTDFGYALGLNYRLFKPKPSEAHHMGHGKPNHERTVILGLELFGALGDTDLGITLNGSKTQHYLAPNISVHFPSNVMVKFGGAIGLTNVSNDMFRLAVGYEF